MKNPSSKKLKAISIMFLLAGVWGLVMGIFYFKNPSFPLAALGIVNITLGVFLGFKQMRKGSPELQKNKK
ncbi:MAG: hypothetical protein ACREBB_02390 [Nitrosotalea sp.]